MEVSVLLDAAAAGAMKAAAASVTSRLGREALRLRGRAKREDLAAIERFDSQLLAVDGQGAPPMPAAWDEQALADWLGSAEVHALLHELLAVHLASAPTAAALRVDSLLQESLINHVAEKDEDAARETAASFFLYFDAVCSDLAAKMGEADPATLERIRQRRTMPSYRILLQPLSAISQHLSGGAPPIVPPTGIAPEHIFNR